MYDWPSGNEEERIRRFAEASFISLYAHIGKMPPRMNQVKTATNDINIWGIHAGKTGDADSMFLGKKCIGLGWAKMGDLAALHPSREAFGQGAYNIQM